MLKRTDAAVCRQLAGRQAQATGPCPQRIPSQSEAGAGEFQTCGGAAEEALPPAGERDAGSKRRGSGQRNEEQRPVPRCFQKWHPPRVFGVTLSVVKHCGEIPGAYYKKTPHHSQLII